MNIALKICILVTSVLSLSAYILINRQSREIKQYFRQSTEEPLTDTAMLLGSAIESDSLNAADIKATFDNIAAKRIVTKIYDFEKSAVDLRILVTDDKGKVVFDSQSGEKTGQDYSRWRDVSQALRGEIGTRTSRDDPRYPDESVFYISVPLRGDNDQIIGTLTLAKPAHNSNLFIEKARRNLIIYGLFFFTILLSLILFSVLYFVNPIRKLTLYATQVADNESPKLPKLPNDEIGTLGAALQNMKINLEGKNYIEKYVRTITHEMKSPLTGIKTAAEIIPLTASESDKQKFSSVILFETDRLTKMVDDLALLSNIQNKELLLGESIDLKGLILDVVNNFKSQSDLNNIKIEFNCHNTSQINGNSYWLRKAIHNLIQNAVDFSPPGGRILVSVATTDSLKVVVSVTDQGSGIPQWALDKIFDPFFSLPRPQNNQRSSGLGLTLVKEIIENHGGSIIVGNIKDSTGKVSGTDVRITL